MNFIRCYTLLVHNSYFNQNQNTDYNVIVDTSSTLLQNINHMTNITKRSSDYYYFFFVSEANTNTTMTKVEVLYYKSLGQGSVLYQLSHI